MRRLIDRRSSRLRPFLSLEALEDRRLLSLGGLLTTILPTGDDHSPQSSSSSVVKLLPDAPDDLLSSVTTIGQDHGDHTQPSASSGPTSGRPDHSDVSVDLLFVHLGAAPLNVSVAPTGDSGPSPVSLGVGSTTVGLPAVAPAGSVAVGGSKGVSVVVDSTTAAVPVAPVVSGQPAPAASPSPPAPSSNTPTPTPAPQASGASLADPGGGGQGNVPAALVAAPTAAPATATAAANVLDATNASGETRSAPTAAVVEAPTSNPTSPPVLAVEAQRGADGAGSPVVAGTVAVPPAAAVPRVEDGGGVAPVAPPAARPDGGGTLVRPPDSLVPDASGLATPFQPFALGRIRQALAGLVGRVASSPGWLGTLLNRLLQWAPWLSGLAVVGVVYEIRRRRRAARSAGDTGVG